MISINRVMAMVIRYWYSTTHSFDRLTDMFYWPAMDLFIWGLTGLYFAKINNNNPYFFNIVLAGLVFWTVIWRVQYEINVNLLQDIWDRTLLSIFVAPLTVYEWITSFIVFGAIKMTVSFAFSAILAFFLYGYNSFTYGPLTILFILNLMITGWAAGFLVAGFIIRFGQKIQTLAWTGVFLLAPFSALYYPVSSLPGWAQKVAYFVPSSQIMEGMREIIFTGKLSYDKLYISTGLNVIYLIIGVSFFIYMFKRTYKKGLGHLV